MQAQTPERCQVQSNHLGNASGGNPGISLDQYWRTGFETHCETEAEGRWNRWNRYFIETSSNAG